MSVNRRNMVSISGMVNTKISGLLLPYFVHILSAKYPIIGLNTAFHTAPIAMIVPATPGEIPAIVVRKNRRNVPAKL